MKYKKAIPCSGLILLMMLIACSGNTKKTGDPGHGAPATAKDTLSDTPLCNLSIDGKTYTVPADSISADYTFSDSSVTITVKGLGGGYLAFIIPNLYKCPAKIPNGFTSVNTKIAGSEERAVRPTLTYSLDPQASNTFNNYNDGQHEGKLLDNAFTVERASKTGVGTNGTGYEHLFKIRVHTTALKNVFNNTAGDKNKDYIIEGDMVIRPRLYL